MLSLFFVFLAVTISADNLLAPKNIFAKDPKAFVSTFSRADKDTLETLLEMTNELLSQGAEDVATAEAARNTLRDDLDAAEAAHVPIDQAYDDAIAALEAASSLVSATSDKLKAEEALEETTLEAKESAQDTLDEKKTKLEKTQKRVTDEKENLNKVLDLLAEFESFRIGFTETNRKLLSKLVMVEGDSIDDVITKVNELIAQADKELLEATSAKEDAQTVYDDAEKAHGHAVTAVADIRGQLNTAKLQEATAEATKNTKKQAHDQSVIKQHDLNDDLEKAEKKLVDEQARVKGEKDTLDQVVAFLEDLIDKASD